MSNTDTEDEEKEVVVPMVKPKLITGGKGPSGEDWLSKYPEDATLLVQRKGKESGVNLHEITIVMKLRRAISLCETHNGQTMQFWVDPKAFCQENELFEVIDPNE